jgi:hypothetical protein
MTRLEANLKILDYIKQYVSDNPTIRFHQVLFNLNINEFSEQTKENIKKIDFDGKTEFKDRYNEESSSTLLKLENVSINTITRI